MTEGIIIETENIVPKRKKKYIKIFNFIGNPCGAVKTKLKTYLFKEEEEERKKKD